MVHQKAVEIDGKFKKMAKAFWKMLKRQIKINQAGVPAMIGKPRTTEQELDTNREKAQVQGFADRQQ